MEETPPAIRIKDGSSVYDFVMFLVRMYAAILESVSSNVKGFSKEFLQSFDLKEFIALQYKLLNNSASATQWIELSSGSFSLILFMVDEIAKGLLDADDTLTFSSNNTSSVRDSIMSFVSIKFSGINDDWDDIFFKNAQYFFDQYKEHCKNNPQFKKAIETISAQNSKYNED